MAWLSSEELPAKCQCGVVTPDQGLTRPYKAVRPRQANVLSDLMRPLSRDPPITEAVSCSSASGKLLHFNGSGVILKQGYESVQCCCSEEYCSLSLCASQALGGD